MQSMVELSKAATNSNKLSIRKSSLPQRKLRCILIIVLTFYVGKFESTAISTTKIQHVGRDFTPIITVDNVLSPVDYERLKKSLSIEQDNFADLKDHNFPGLVAELDITLVKLIVNSILKHTDIMKLYSAEMFKVDEISGFASVVCREGHIHSDHISDEIYGVVPPALVFYVSHGSIATTSNTTGTAFYREKETNLERTSKIDNLDVFCAQYPKSVGCDVYDDIHEYYSDKDRFSEIYRVENVPNRFVIYPQDLLHNAIHEEPKFCNPKEGRLAISLFFKRKQVHTHFLINDAKTTVFIDGCCNNEHILCSRNNKELKRFVKTFLSFLLITFCISCVVYSGRYRFAEPSTILLIVLVAFCVQEVVGLRYCGAGEKLSSSGNSCYGCAAGTAQSSNSHRVVPCPDCPQGKYQNEWGKSTCKNCPAGKKQSQTKGTNCDSCSVTTFNTADGSTSCSSKTTCVAGKFISHAGSTTTDRTCSNCGAGKFTDGNDESECGQFATCVTGKYISDVGSASEDRTCSECGTGQYTVLPNMSACSIWTTCSVGKFMVADGTQSSDRVCENWTNCDAGYKIKRNGSAAVDRNCTQCPLGKFSAAKNQFFCEDWKDCEAGEKVLAAGSGMTDRACTNCELGQYTTVQNLPACSTCYIPPEGNVSVKEDCIQRTQIVVTGKLNVTGVPDANGVLPKIIGGGSNRLFKVESGGELVVKYLNLTGGDVSGNDGTNDNNLGGAVYVNNGHFNATDTVLSFNNANSGGGIYGKNGAKIVMSNSNVTGNVATVYGGGVYCNGGLCTFQFCSIQSNVADSGGGIVGIFMFEMGTMFMRMLYASVATRMTGANAK